MRLHLWAVCLGVFIQFAAPLHAETEPGVITVIGEGVVAVTPDMALIGMGVSYEAPEAGEAARQTAEDMRALVDTLVGFEIEPRDIQTTQISLTPVWGNSTSTFGSTERREITGFLARHSVQVRVRNLETLPELLDRIVQDGANTFNGLEFKLQDPQPSEDLARDRAVTDALRRAEVMARAAAVELGQVRAIIEMGAAPSPLRMEMRAASSAAPVPVAPGELEVRARVTLEIQIAQ